MMKKPANWNPPKAPNVVEEALDESDGFTEIKSGEAFFFQEPGDMIVGVLLNTEQGGLGNTIYEFEVSPGDVRTVFGTTVLDQKMSKVEMGQLVRITFLGEKVSEKKRTYKNFKVEVKTVDSQTKR